MKILKSTEYTYLKENSGHFKNWGFILLIPGIILLISGFLYPENIYVLLILGLILSGIGAANLRKSRNYETGIEGEAAVAQVLQELDDTHYLINDLLVKANGGNIDHILLSPEGIFVIETKNYSGQIRCYGDKWFRKGNRRSYSIPSISSQAKRNAQDVSNLIYRKTNIRLFVIPICVFTNPEAELRITHPTTAVLSIGQLTQFIRQYSSKHSFSNAELQKIAESILSGTTMKSN